VLQLVVVPSWGPICSTGGTMPFESDRQRRFMYAKHPKIARRWTREAKKKGESVTKSLTEIRKDDYDSIRSLANKHFKERKDARFNTVHRDAWEELINTSEPHYQGAPGGASPKVAARESAHREYSREMMRLKDAEEASWKAKAAARAAAQPAPSPAPPKAVAAPAKKVGKLKLLRRVIRKSDTDLISIAKGRI